MPTHDKKRDNKRKDSYDNVDDIKWRKFENSEVKNDKISLSKIDLDSLIDYAEWLAKKSLTKVKAHQIRRFFNAIKNIKLSVEQNDQLLDKDRVKLLMIRPQLANASAKQYQLKDLAIISTAMIKKVVEKEDFDLFYNFFESLVAFHKVYGED